MTDDTRTGDERLDEINEACDEFLAGCTCDRCRWVRAWAAARGQP